MQVKKLSVFWVCHENCQLEKEGCYFIIDRHHFKTECEICHLIYVKIADLDKKHCHDRWKKISHVTIVQIVIMFIAM